MLVNNSTISPKRYLVCFFFFVASAAAASCLAAHLRHLAQRVGRQMPAR